MKNKRKGRRKETPEELFYRLDKADDLILIATNPANWCYDYKMFCDIDDPRQPDLLDLDDGDIEVDTNVYRSLSTPDLCIQEKTFLSNYDKDYEYDLFYFKNLEEILDEEVHVSMHLYIAAERKRKLKHFMSCDSDKNQQEI